jgi:hypothetical protein
MSSKRPKDITPSGGGGLFTEVTQRVKLIIRLMGDNRVSPFLKVIPVFSVLYWLIPDLLPGPIDDAGLIFLGGYLFVELCPPAVVEEHMQALGIGKEAKDDVIEGEFKDVSDPNPEGKE